METETVKDVTENVSAEVISVGVIVAHQKDNNVLILKKDERPVKRFDGKSGSYRIEYRWLSNPDNVHSVQGSESTIWTYAELKQALAGIKKGKTLFDFFNLF